MFSEVLSYGMKQLYLALTSLIWLIFLGIKSFTAQNIPWLEKRLKEKETKEAFSADKSEDAIFKVLSILAPMFSSFTVQDGGENALRTKTSFLWL